MDLTRWLVLSMTLMLLAACAPLTPEEPQAPREYAGILVGATRWAGEVILADDVIIPRGSSLEIAPGTRVRVRPSLSTKIEPEQLSSATELLIRGRFTAHGSAAQPIEFVIEGEPSVTVAWAGVIGERAEAFAMEHVVLSRAEQGVWLVATPATIRHVVVRDSRYGMVFQRSAEIEVRDSRIEAGEAGLFCWRGAAPRLIDNEIRDQVEEGLFIDALSRPLLHGNRIVANGVGLVAPERTFAADNQLVDNKVDLLLLGGAR